MAILDGRVLITLDLDDTLWDNIPTLQYAEDILYAWLKKHTKGITDSYTIDDLKAYRRQYGRDNPTLKHDLTRLRYESLCHIGKRCGYSHYDIERAMRVFLKARNRVTLYDDVIPALRTLSEKYHLAALSNGNADILQIGIKKYFDMSITSADIGSSKPEPDMFHAVMEYFKLAQSSVVHIGDEPETDILGAHRAGIDSVWLNRKQVPWPQHLHAPTFEINSLLELLQD